MSVSRTAGPPSIGHVVRRYGAVPERALAREKLLAKGGKQTQEYSPQANYIDMEPKWPFTIELLAQSMVAPAAATPK